MSDNLGAEPGLDLDGLTQATKESILLLLHGILAYTSHVKNAVAEV